ncbi:MAG: helix-turn-helix transcriptional regulator [Nitrosarchaeum sp.]|nr:helix-turn-helix transcriptional regulator [Nitrosarchaeum sp.]
MISEQMKCCPVDNTFKIIGKKFTIHILRNITMLNQNRFNQFLESIEGINPKTLSVRLKEMEKSELINRKVFNETPIRIEYSVTEKGKALKPIIMQMAAFSMKYCSCEVFKDGKPRTVEQVFGKK